ncbi:MAG: ATP-binding protein [Bradyrhizobium sp.]|nr:ATP-binding protein [Bradyrhizobium sp.]
MLAGFARQINSLSFSKAGCHAGLASLLLLAGAGAVQDATALNETRTLSFHHTHSDEDLTVTFKRDGRYDEEALKKLNHFLRDWRSQEQTTMDRRLFDILWEVYRDVDARKPINIISSYRSPATNSMLRRRSSGVARNSQHVLGHAIDFFIPEVPLEQVRAAGLRLQRGGVGFYPTSGSPFVHLDTGSVRHWPRMNYDQLARVFPDGRTVHVPTNGKPLKGYELALADLEKRGSGDEVSSKNKPGLFAALFRSKSNDEEDEGASAPAAPAAGGKPSPVGVMAAVAPVKSADPVPMPRAKPVGSTFQLASADAQIVPVPKPKQAASADKAEAKPQTPADIINARGFWDAAPKQATPAQIAAISARNAVNSSDPQATASVTEAFNKALAYAPAASSPVDRANIVAASAPIPRSARPARNPLVAPTIDTVVAKGQQGQPSVVATATRIAASKGNDVWMRVMILAPSATTSMSATVLGDSDMTVMRTHFVKPQAIVAMSFSDDPQLGLICDRFTGSATARLATQSFVMRTAALR